VALNDARVVNVLPKPVLVLLPDEHLKMGLLVRSAVRPRDRGSRVLHERPVTRGRIVQRQCALRTTLPPRPIRPARPQSGTILGADAPATNLVVRQRRTVGGRQVERGLRGWNLTGRPHGPWRWLTNIGGLLDLNVLCSLIPVTREVLVGVRQHRQLI